MSTQFAIDTSNRITHISESERGLSCNCSCIVCGERMVAKKGEEREHHFAHESNKIACVVNHETLLHQFAKRVIQEAGGLMVPPVTGLPSVSIDNPYSRLNLDRIEVEKEMGDIRPDLIGYSGDDPILIEVAYSSFVKWLVSQEIVVEQKPRYIEEIITIKGIWVSLRELPFGGLAIKVMAYNPEVNAIVKAIAKRYYGRWRQDYKNWIVENRWLQHARNDLRAAADLV